jgi:hypothetical protein
MHKPRQGRASSFSLWGATWDGAQFNEHCAGDFIVFRHPRRKPPAVDLRIVARPSGRSIWLWLGPVFVLPARTKPLARRTRMRGGLKQV